MSPHTNTGVVRAGFHSQEIDAIRVDTLGAVVRIHCRIIEDLRRDNARSSHNPDVNEEPEQGLWMWWWVVTLQGVWLERDRWKGFECGNRCCEMDCENDRFGGGSWRHVSVIGGWFGCGHVDTGQSLTTSSTESRLRYRYPGIAVLLSGMTRIR